MTADPLPRQVALPLRTATMMATGVAVGRSTGPCTATHRRYSRLPHRWRPLALGPILALLAGCAALEGGPLSPAGGERPPTPAIPTPEMAASFGELEYRILSEAAEEELDVGGGRLAFVLAVDINGTITPFRIEDAVVEPLDFPLENIVSLRTLTPVTVFVFERREGNTHICGGGVVGGSGGSVCPSH